VFASKLRTARGEMSLRRLAALVPCDPGLLSKLENRKQAPSEKLAARLDDVLGCRGELIGASRLDRSAAVDADPWQTVELLNRVQASDTTPATLEAVHAAVVELCCAYSCTPALTLRADTHRWLKRLSALLRKPVGLKAHQQLLTDAGWLALLAGCVEYDAGMRASAEATRVAAAQLGAEAGVPEITGWACEMSAWYALTQGRYRDVLTAADRGLQAAGTAPVAVQLHAQRAKALGRLGDAAGVTGALSEASMVLDRLPAPERSDSHFAIDPTKFDVYAMDAYRLVRDDEQASEYARRAIRSGTLPDGTEVSPMRVAEARLTLAAVAARSGDLEQAVSEGVTAFLAERKSLPSLLMVGGEVEAELNARYPDEALTDRFREVVRSIRA
jgi:helix-turn-helix protein